MSASFIKILIRNLFFLVLAGLVCGLLFYFDFIDLIVIRQSLKNYPYHVALFGLVQFLVLYLSTARYQLILSSLQVHTTQSRVFKANIVAQGLGQYLPASMAFIEFLRISILSRDVRANGTPSQWQILTLGAFFDRIFAQGIMFLLGGAFSLALISGTSDRTDSSGMVLLTSLFCLGSGILFLIVFIYFDLFVSVLRLVMKQMPSHWSAIASISNLLDSPPLTALSRYLKMLRGNSRQLFLCGAYSAGITISTSFALHLSAEILKLDVNFATFVAVLPLISIASILPLNFGGFGGNQLVAMGLFTVFGYSMSEGASITFLYATLSLFFNTLITVPFIFKIPEYLKQTRGAKPSSNHEKDI